MNSRMVFLFSACCSLSLAQSLIGIPATRQLSLDNQTELELRRASRLGTKPLAISPQVVIFTGDRVISQFVDGGAWQTSITVTNLETHSTKFDVYFFADDGTDLNVPLVG